MKKIFILVSIVAITIGIFISPYSIDFDLSKSKANAISEVKELKSEKKLMFYGSDLSAEKLNDIKKNEKDDSLVQVKQKIKDNEIKATAKKGSKEVITSENLQEYTDVAFDVKLVRKDLELQKHLHNLLQNGKKVYLYGGLTFEEYKQLLNIEEMTAEASDPTSKSKKMIIAEFGSDKKEKGSKKEHKNSSIEEDEEIREVIGYTLDPNDANKVFVSDITVNTKLGKATPSEEHFLHEVLDGVYITTKKEKEQSESKETKVSGIFSKNSAYAGNITRKSSPYTYSSSAYSGSMLVGRVYTDWYLLQNTDESEYAWDYFVVKDRKQTYSYNGARTTYLYVDHDIPCDCDEIEDWSPWDDSGGASYGISIGWPWNISVSYGMASNPKIDQQGSTAYDYGRWVVTDADIGDGEIFYPHTGWKSSGTMATMDIRHKATFYANEYVGGGLNQHIDVSYDYATRNQ
ncbi:hypothetical protein [uncultured Metabacillus sp.]|uniref:hypothetical protein n=1 Tax=uncultured Metabacillus sp. TaxID=2860135 RepID=UPI00260D7ED2|nr:hypothetical protein [uncultured Metabacillus sp.]